MKKVHQRFTGKRGTLAQFGDSITVTLAYWAPLAYGPKEMPHEMAAALAKVKKYIAPECWDKWKGGKYGSEGGMTIRWALENIDGWLKANNPETAIIMFGSNDVGAMEVAEYARKTRDVVRRCLEHGTVAILTTPPPRHARVEKSAEFADAVRQIAREEHLPLIDFHAEILQRRAQDWDGALPQFKNSAGDEYQVLTLIARDGVHPSNPKDFSNKYSAEALRTSGYSLRNYLSLLAYADVIEKVLEPK
jgi:lysophospholipase L1-like esterase